MAKAKKATAKAATKKVAAKPKTVKKAAAAPKATAKKAASKRKPPAAFMRPLTPSPQLAAVVGASALPRTAVVSKIWDYIRKNGLQDSVNRRNINADDKLKAIFGKNSFSMFEMNKLIGKHLK